MKGHLGDSEILRHGNGALNYEQGMSINSGGEAPILKGVAAPDFTLPMPEGEFLSLQEIRGRKILLVFLRNFACVP